MTKEDLVVSIGDDLTALDQMLVSPKSNMDEAHWQQMFAMRKHLDDQQRQLVKQTIDEDDAVFKSSAALIDTASQKLQGVLGQMNQIDATFRLISQISASLDMILTAI